ncbi:MAG: hypothetical protein AAB890_00235 [Patescibacteria group bacterium]
MELRETIAKLTSTTDFPTSANPVVATAFPPSLSSFLKFFVDKILVYYLGLCGKTMTF